MSCLRTAAKSGSARRAAARTGRSPHSLAASACSSRPSGSGQASPALRARFSTRWTAGWLSPQARAISLWERPASWLSRMIRLILLIAILFLGIA